jgi:two-component system sensor histidine kinase TctE
MTDVVRVAGSLRNRLAFTLVGGAAVLAIVLFVVVRSYAAQIAQQGQDRIIGASVSSILDAAVVRDGVVEVDFPYASLSMLSTPFDDRVFYAIYQDDTVISGYDNLPRINTARGDASDYQTVDFDGVPIRLASASRMLIGADVRTQVVVSVAQTQDALSGTLNSISRNVAWFGAGFFALAALIAYWATATTFGQLQTLTTAITRRGPKDLRPVVKPIPAELAPLVSSLNSLMARLNQSLLQSENFITEAAHRVRTPLATVRSHAETTLQRVDKDQNRQALRSMIRAIDESSRAAGQLLDHAMIAFRADDLDKQDIDLCALVNELLLQLTPIAEMKDIDLEMLGDAPVAVSGDPILVQNAVRNLIDNALKYSPAESKIEITVRNTPYPQVMICDRGSGFAPDEIADLAKRFKRGTNVAGIVGSGLGLTIVQDVATAHGGHLALENRPEGGACVTLSF